MLWVSHTFSRNESARNYSSGQFNNIRIMGGNDVNDPYAAWPPAYGSGARASNPWMTAAQAVPEGCIDAQNCPLFQTSGACWYALTSAAEQGVDVPLGLIALTLGGQRIEEFMNNVTGAVGPYVCDGLNSQNIKYWNGELCALSPVGCCLVTHAVPLLLSSHAATQTPPRWHVHDHVHGHVSEGLALVSCVAG